MNKTKSLLLAAGVLLALAFTLSCSGNDPDDPLTSGKASLAEKLKALEENAVSNTEYVFELTRDENIEAQRLYYSGKENITIRLTSSGGEKIISLTGNGSLFEIGQPEHNVTLILENGVTLLGHDSNEYPLIEVYWGGTLIMNDGAKISGNTNAASYNGGGIYVNFGTFIMEGGEISGNTASYGGGVNVNAGTFTMKGGEISGNTASYGGGGVFRSTSSEAIFNMEGGEISGNTASSGGGVYSERGGNFTMKGGKISGNTATGGGDGYARGGGGVYANFIMEGGEISSNTATNGNGGGLHTSNFTIKSGKISGNTAFSKGGGVFSDGTFTMEGGEISDNTATNDDGGGVYAYDFAVEGGKISGNTTSNSGGGVYSSGTTVTIKGGEISGNTATGGDGGGVYANGSWTTMEGGEIFGNTASNNGGGVYSSNSFIKTGGTIYGDNGSNGNKATGGLGNAVAVDYHYSSIKLRNTTAGPEVNLNSRESGETGGWEN